MRKQKKRGFTLIELIVVVAILVALLLILVPRLTGFTSTAAEVQCQQTRQKVMEMYNAYQIKGEPVSIEDLLKNKDDEYFISTPKCASGGKLTALEIKGVISLIKCSKHGSLASDNLDYTPKGIQQTMISIMQEFNKDPKLMKEYIKYMNNDLLRDFIKNDVYGGSWPPLDNGIVEAAKLPKGDYKIQICYNHNDYTNISKENAIIYASPNENNTNWKSNHLIYDPDENRWYTGSDVLVANQTWSQVKEQMKEKGWKPVEYSE